jgi:hypothetical protein
VYIYRFLLLRLQGEAKLLDAPDEGPAAGAGRAARAFSWCASWARNSW